MDFKDPLPVGLSGSQEKRVPDSRGRRAPRFFYKQYPHKIALHRVHFSLLLAKKMTSGFPRTYDALTRLRN
uniref:Uncharacterized protein n=1 Tax=Hyaloperonospora arabidopsidis (strain Emoy2) TaxID=559515 RepID=M4BAG8_HYAAE